MDWHRLFGLLLTDFFTDSYAVELEKDLSLIQQFLDVLILRKGRGRCTVRLPDGLDDLVPYNLVTFKSHQEALTDWTFKELTGHYVAYRKQVSPAEGPLLPEAHFRLYAVCSRYPHNLAGALALEQVRPGIYNCRRGTDVIRVIVVRQLPEAAHNAPLHLFSASAEQVAYAAAHYRQRSDQTSTLLHRLFEGYQQEGLAVPYTMDDFVRDYVKEHLQVLSPEERLKGLSPEEIERFLKKLKAESSGRPQGPPRRRRRKE